jgi:hypothetical protein
VPARCNPVNAPQSASTAPKARQTGAHRETGRLLANCHAGLPSAGDAFDAIGIFRAHHSPLFVGIGWFVACHDPGTSGNNGDGTADRILRSEIR